MKQTVLFICVLFFVSACRTPEKIASSTSENIKTSEKQDETGTSETHNFTDTTKMAGIEINNYKIEFYPPTAWPNEPDTIQKNKLPPTGAIKSIEGYTIKSVNRQTGVNEEKGTATTNKTGQNSTDITGTVKVTEQPAADPYRWRYIFGIVVVTVLAGIAAWFGLRKCEFVATVISFVKKLF